MSVTYLTTPIAEARRDYPTPGSGMTREGYTKLSGAPSSIMIRLQGEKRWRRLMVWQFSNLGTMFVNLKGGPHVVREEELPPIQEVGPKPSSAHARKKAHLPKKTSVQLDREIAASLAGGRRSHATKKISSTLFAVEIDPREFDRERTLPSDAVWRNDLVHLAETELARGRSYRRPKDARYAVIEWTGYRAGVGHLLTWLEASPGITRYAEIFE